MGHSWSMAPSLALAHLLVTGIGELLLMVPLARSANLLLPLRGSYLLLPAVDVLLVARTRLYVVQLLVDQVELGAVVIDVVLVVDNVLTVIYYLLLDQIATLA